MQRAASLMALVTTLGIIVILLMGPAIWFYYIDQVVAEYGPGMSGAELTLQDRLTGTTVAMIAAAVRVYGLLGLRRMFLEARDGRPLSARAVRGFRRFARVEFAMVFVAVIQESLSVAIATAAHSDVPNALPISFGSSEIGALFLASLLLFAAELMAQGHRADEENKSFV